MCYMQIPGQRVIGKTQESVKIDLRNDIGWLCIPLNFLPNKKIQRLFLATSFI